MPKSFNYMLRKTLPLWKWQETIDEVIAYCKECNVAEVIWKVDTEEFSHGLPTMELLRKYEIPLKTAREACVSNNIKFSINPWVSVGHEDRGRDMSKAFPQMKFLVDNSGAKSTACACPLSTVWQDWICEAYGFYASLQPNILWVEDDFRLFGHGQIKFGCFCEAHLQEFAKITGEYLEREELLALLLKEGEPHPYRKLWLDMNGKIMAEVITKIEKAVHGVSPKVQIGLMCSNPANHAVEGRNWHEIADNIRGENLPVARPSMGSYNEFLPVTFIECMDIARTTIACLPDDTVICPELESCFFTAFAKSIRYTRLQLGVTALLGYENITLNMYNHMGGKIASDDRFMYLLRDVKDKLEAIQNGYENDKYVQDVGVTVEFVSDSPYYVKTSADAQMLDLSAKTLGWSIALQACGIPVTFKDSPLKAITGQYFRSKTHEQIIKLLKGGLLLDSTSAYVLQEMGYGEYLGVTIDSFFHKDSLPIGAEEFSNAEFGGEPNKYMTMLFTTRYEIFAKMSADSDAKIISHITDCDRVRLMPAMTAYENKLGGRICVYSADMSEGPSAGLQTCFLNNERVVQLGSAVSWLSRKDSFYQNLSYPYQYTLIRKYKDYDFIGIANLSSDSVDKIVISLDSNDKPIDRVEFLQDSSWINTEFKVENNILTLNQEIEYKDFTVVKIFHK